MKVKIPKHKLTNEKLCVYNKPKKVYIPLISGVLSPALLIMGQINIYDTLISIIVLIFTNMLFIKYGMRIYKVGILNYSSSNVWKKIGKSLKNK